MYINELPQDRKKLDTMFELVNKYSKGLGGKKLYIFVGAGFSAQFNLPTWWGLVDKLFKRIMYSSEILQLPNPEKVQLFIEKTRVKNIDIKLKLSLLMKVLTENGIDLEVLHFHLIDELKVNDDLIVNRDVLQQLGRLNAFFITSNFDKVLNKTLHIDESYYEEDHFLGNLDNKAIIHTHGLIEDEYIENFMEKIVFTFEKYIETYNVYDSAINSRLYNILNSSKETDKMILFLGSSLQEPELLGILQSSPDFKVKYALYDFESKYEFKIYSKYYKDVFDIDIVGYNSSKGFKIFERILDDLSKRTQVTNDSSNKTLSDLSEMDL